MEEGKEKITISSLLESCEDDMLIIEATVDTGFEFMAVKECHEKFGQDLPIMKERGRIVFKIEKSKYPMVSELRSVDNLYMIISFIPEVGLKGTDSAEDLEIAKKLAHIPDWDRWLKTWCELMDFKGIVKPTLQQFAVANDRATKDKELEKSQQAERQRVHKERQKKQADRRAQRNARRAQNKKDAGARKDSQTEEVATSPGIEGESAQLTDSKSEADEEEKPEVDKSKDADEAIEKIVDSDLKQLEKKEIQLDSQVDVAAEEKEKVVDSDLKLLEETEIQLDTQVDAAAEEKGKVVDSDLKQLEEKETQLDSQVDAAALEKLSVEPTEFEIVTPSEEKFEKKQVDEDFSVEGDSAVMEESPQKDGQSETVMQNEEEENSREDSESEATALIPEKILEADGANGGEESEVESLVDPSQDSSNVELDDDILPAERVLRFRATCFRTGNKHSFGSMEAAREFGGELQEKFNWIVHLTKYHAEVVLNLNNDSAEIGLALTKQSLHRRNIAFFGPTTLRATVCHNMLRMADIKPGDIVIDPLAGGCSIPIEGSISFPKAFHIGGDNHFQAINRSYSNIRHLQQEKGKNLPLDYLKWDARRLPIKEASVDAIVSDLPFGVRMGSKLSNRSLYVRILCEMARVARPGIGRAILLTQDRISFNKALLKTCGMWWQSHVLSANIGGLDAAVFTLRRTSKMLTEEELAAELQQSAERDRSYSNFRGRGRGQGYGRNSRGRGNSWGRGRGQWQGGGRGGGCDNRSSGNWRERETK